jgi:hypothetical protein
MKFTTKKVFTMFICILLALEFCIAFERKARHHRSQMRLSKLHRTEKPEYFINVTNKWWAFIAGLIVQMGGGETEWMKCLPNHYLKDTPPEDESENQKKEQKGYSTWSPILKSIIDVVGTIGKAICWVRTHVMTLIKLIIAGVKTFTERRKFFRFKERSSIKITRKTHTFSMKAIAYHKGHFNLSKRNMLKIKGWFDELWDTISSAISTVGHAIFSGVEAAYHFVASGVSMAAKAIKKGVTAIVDWAAEKYAAAVASLQAIADYLTSLVNKIKSFFQGSLWTRIKNIIMCIKSAKALGSVIYEVVKSIVGKVKSIVKAVTMGPVGLAALADIILALLCSWADFAKAADFFVQASAETNKIKAYEYWGRGLGKILYIIGMARTLSETFSEAIEDESPAKTFVTEIYDQIVPDEEQEENRDALALAYGEAKRVKKAAKPSAGAKTEPKTGERRNIFAKKYTGDEAQARLRTYAPRVDYD